MAYTAYKTYAVGDILTAADMNVYQRDNGLEGPVAKAATTGYVFEVSATNEIAEVSPPRVLWIPAVSYLPPSANGAAPFVVHGTNISYEGSDFDQTTEEHLDVLALVPTLYDGGDIDWCFVWTAAAGTGAVVWELNMATPADNVAIDGALTAIGTVTDTLQNTGRIHLSPVLTQAANKPTARDLLALRVSRKAGDSADTLSADARLIGVIGEF